MKYFIEARISNILSGEFLEGFQRNLISQMQIGVECGYDEGLKKIKRNADNSAAIQRVKNYRRKRII